MGKQLDRACMALFNAKFKRKPVPWVYTFAGALLFTAILKMHPFHRGMRKLEVKNLVDYFKSNFVPETARRSYATLHAWWVCYINSVKRVLALSNKARQDYFALNRVGCFSSEEIPAIETQQFEAIKQTPLLIVPGLNTPSVFFKEMYSYFSEKGFPVSVMNLPERGLMDISTASHALEGEIARIKAHCKTENVNVIGHCLGGIIGQYYLKYNLAEGEKSPIQNLITLGTGFMGADGVQNLKEAWAAGHPTQAVPKIFDELIGWNMDIAVKAGEVAYHNFITVWDFIVYFQKGLLNTELLDSVKNYIIDDADIDHITIALSQKVFQRIEVALAEAAIK
jgi:phosphatidylglycerophosphatase A